MKNKRPSKILAITLVCLIIASLSGVFPTTLGAAGKFNIGDTVEVTTNLNVRTGPGTSYPEITDPDYPGYAPQGTKGKVLGGPSSADGYIWWQVDFGPGLYSGWSVEGGLEKVSQPPPPPPTPISPGSSSQPGPEINDLTPTLQWSGVSNADYYALAISVYPYGSTNIVYNPQQLYGTSHSVPSGVLEYGKRYRWNMQAHNSAGWSSVSSTLYFQIYTPVQTPTVETRGATDVTQIAATLNGRIISDGGSSILERRFDWGTTSSCADGWTASVSVSGNDFSYRLTGLNPNTTYYFRAWAKNSAGWSQGSVLSFTTTQANVTLTLYVHEGSASGPVLSGARVTGQDDGGNSFDKTTNYSGYVTITGTPGTWSFTASKTGYETNSWSQSITSTTTKHAYLVKVVQKPSPPTPLSPGSGSSPGPTIDTLTPTLQWSGVSNADYYALAISKYPYGLSNIVYNPQQLYGTSHTVPSGKLEYGQKYRWNMQAHNSAGWSDVSSTLYFQTEEGLLPAPSLVSPSNYDTNVSTTPIFSWSAVSGASSYRIMVGTSYSGLPTDPTASTGSGLVINTTTYSTSYTPSSGVLSEDSTYYWEVHARSSTKYGEWSSKWRFTTKKGVPSPPTPLSPGSSPSPGPTIDTLTPTLQWSGVSNADYYALAISKYPYGSSNIIYNPQQLYGTSHTVPSGKLEYGQKYRWNMQAHNSAGWSNVSTTLYFQTAVADVTLTLYVHEGSASGPVLSGVRVTGQDGGGNSFDKTTNYSGYVTISGTPGTWSFTASKTGYETNSWSQSITSTTTKHAYLIVVQKPDLIIEAITWSPSSPSIGETVTFTVTIENKGTDKAGNSKIYYFIDNAQHGYDYVNSIEPGATAMETFTWKAQAGPHAIKAVADYKDEVAESDETNNDKTVTFSTTALSDLIIESITWSPLNPSVGDTVTFTVTIKNQGSGKAGSSKVYYFVNNAQLSYDSVNSIDPSATATETFTWKARDGAHTIKAVADYKEEVTESDETNNEKTVTFSATALSDLIIESITWSPSRPSIGDTVTFTVTIKNQGTGKAGGSKVHYFIDNAQHGYDDVTSLDSGATAQETFAWKTQDGLHTIKAVADYKEEVPESSETNNDKTVTFSVTEEIVSVPNTPSGPTTGVTAISYTYSTGGATSSYGHDIEYRFDWGDGNYSTWSSSTSASHSWSSQGTYTVRAQARCATHTNVLSDWSGEITVSIIAETISAKIDSYSPANPVEVQTGESVPLRFTFINTGNTDWTFYAAASLRKPDGTEVDLPLKPVTLSPGDQGNVSWSYTIDQEGGWDLVFGIWKEEEQVNSLRQTGWINDCIVGKAPEAAQPAIGSSPASFSFTAVEGQANPSSQTLNIWNSGAGVLEWGVGSDVTWLLLSLASGSSTGETDTVRVSVDISGMDAGDYRETMTIRSTGATSTSRVVPVSLSISPQPVAPPDLTVPLVEAPSEGIAGQSISVTFVVENRGDDASGPFHNFVALSPKSKPWGTNVFLADIITDSILPDDSKRVTVEGTIPALVSSPSDYYVTVYADALEKVRESNEGNNIGSTYPTMITITSQFTTLAELIEKFTVDKVQVTVGDEQFSIVTLENRIDPDKLEAILGSGATKVYIDSQGSAVSDEKKAQKIGVIDWTRHLLQGSGSFWDLSIRKTQVIAREIDHWEVAMEKDLIDILSGLGLATPVILLIKDHILDPTEELRSIAKRDLSRALEEYNLAQEVIYSAAGGELLKLNEITDYANARQYLEHYLKGSIYEEKGFSFLSEINELHKGTARQIEEAILRGVLGIITSGLSGFVELVYEGANLLEREDEYYRERNQAILRVTDELDQKFYMAAPYTLELAHSPRINFEAHSPVEIRVYDSQGRVTGIVNGKERTEIPYSVYRENAITIFLPTDSYRLEISGTGEGSYDVSVTRVAGQDVDKFTAAKIPVSVKATHQLSINWDTFSQEEDKLPIQVDSDGDGIAEEDKTVYLSVVGKEDGLPAWIWFAIGLVVGLIVSLLAWRRMIKNKERAEVEPVTGIQQREDDQSGSC